jgi:hypothetical protein
MALVAPGPAALAVLAALAVVQVQAIKRHLSLAVIFLFSGNANAIGPGANSAQKP